MGSWAQELVVVQVPTFDCRLPTKKVTRDKGFKHLTAFGVQMPLRSVQMSMPVILERRRRLNAERSEAI